MCGIAGIISANPQNVSRQRLQKMTDSLRHRGPDGEGFWINENNTVGFGHRRLAIIDVSNAGMQPMHYADRYTITYNGELYNYLEIKDSLLKKGYAFTSQCDTEVVLAAYACYGPDCLQHFDGMFAFAIWDSHEQSMFCARDRFGEKPFYYHYSYHDKQLVFGSEMKALWAADIERKTDKGMLLNYLTLGWVQNPVNRHQTFFHEIQSLPPSHCLLFSFTVGNEPVLTVKSYWDIDKEAVQANTDESMLVQQFSELLGTSVKRRLRSDVPVGSSLSGGLDSSAIVALVNKLLTNADRQKTFSAVFPGFVKDEAKHVKEVVKQFNLQNYTTTPTAASFINDFEKVAWHQEEPFQSASIYAQYAVYQLAAQHGVTVILDGQGADETLAGYTKYYHWYWQEKIAARQWKDLKSERAFAKKNGVEVSWGLKNYIAAFLPQVAANQLQRKAGGQQANHPFITREFYEANYDKATIYKPAIAKLNDILYYNIMQSGLEELLRYADRNSMAHSREVRLPFLSHELVQFVFSVPAAFKICRGFTKYLLRLSMADKLPNSIVWRTDKVGFEPPQKQWLQDANVQEYIHESRKKLVHEGILKKSVVDKPVLPQSAHEEGNYDFRYMCAAQMMYDL